jgi:hypothetical protein
MFVVHVVKFVNVFEFWQRSRDCESTISIEYLRALERGYEEFISHISKLIPVIRINWFVTYIVHLE